jgi:hypothetical protein
MPHVAALETWTDLQCAKMMMPESLQLAFPMRLSIYRKRIRFLIQSEKIARRSGSDRPCKDAAQWS